MPERLGIDPKNEKIAPGKSVLWPYDYLVDVGQEARRAHVSIVAQSMLIEDSRAARLLADAFKQAPDSVRKILFIDEYAFLVLNNTPEVLLKKRGVLGHRMSDEKKKKFEFLINEFKKNGVELQPINSPENKLGHIVPWFDRDHIKTTVIDDGKKVYIGGVNFNRSDDYIDFMVKYDGPVAQQLANTLNDLRSGKMVENTKQTLDEYTTLMVDTGSQRDSLIVSKVSSIVAEARQKVEHIAMFAPDGEFRKALLSAAQGTREKTAASVEVIVSSKQLGADPLMLKRAWQQGYDVLRARRLKVLEKRGIQIVKVPKMVHAKLVIVDRGTPHQKAYFGAHNLNRGAALARMKEWGIITTDPELIANLGRFYDESKKHSKASVE